MTHSNHQHKVALVTGVSSGIGKATARRLAELGYRVFGTSRDPEKCPAIPNVVVVQMDLTQPGSVEQCASEVFAQAGRIDLLINNAGAALIGSLEETPDTQMRSMFELNLFGHVRLINAVLPDMRRRRAGQIINISSLLGQVSLPYMGIYSSAKFAMEGYSEALAKELAPLRIHVSLVEPGFVHTGILEHGQIVKNPISDYDVGRTQIIASVKDHVGKATNPEVVATRIVAIARNGRGRLRNAVGLDSHLINCVRRLVPSWILDIIWRREFGLNNS